MAVAEFAAQNLRWDDPSLWTMTTKVGSYEAYSVFDATKEYWERDLLRYLSKPQLMSLIHLLSVLSAKTASHLVDREREDSLSEEDD